GSTLSSNSQRRLAKLSSTATSWPRRERYMAVGQPKYPSPPRIRIFILGLSPFSGIVVCLARFIVQSARLAVNPRSCSRDAARLGGSEPEIVTRSALPMAFGHQVGRKFHGLKPCRGLTGQ